LSARSHHDRLDKMVVQEANGWWNGDLRQHHANLRTRLKGKQARDTIPSESRLQHPRVLHRVYSDLVEPIQTQSRSGEQYILDGNTHFVKVKLLRLKSETAVAPKHLIERAEVETGKRLTYFRSDGGSEYGSNGLATYIESK
jgi:hypothetical protein